MPKKNTQRNDHVRMHAHRALRSVCRPPDWSDSIRHLTHDQEHYVRTHTSAGSHGPDTPIRHAPISIDGPVPS